VCLVKEKRRKMRDAQEEDSLRGKLEREGKVGAKEGREVIQKGWEGDSPLSCAN